MEMGCIGFLIGAITAIIMIGIGVCFGGISNIRDNTADRVNEGCMVLSRGSDSNFYDNILSGNWNRCVDERNHQPDEIE